MNPPLEVVIPPDAILRAAADTFEAKNREYGNAYKDYGAAFLELFPDRKIPAINDPADASRFALLFLCHMKLHRYTQNLLSGGHIDSARDLAVYAAMLESLTS